MTRRHARIAQPSAGENRPDPSICRPCGDRGAALDETAIRRTILELLVERGEGKTICPSEAARALDARGFRDIMPAVRAVAQTLVEEGRLEVTQRGRAVDIRAATGPVRLRTLP